MADLISDAQRAQDPRTGVEIPIPPARPASAQSAPPVPQEGASPAADMASPGMAVTPPQEDINFIPEDQSIAEAQANPAPQVAFGQELPGTPGNYTNSVQTGFDTGGGTVQVNPNFDYGAANAPYITRERAIAAANQQQTAALTRTAGEVTYDPTYVGNEYGQRDASAQMWDNFQQGYAQREERIRQLLLAAPVNPASNAPVGRIAGMPNPPQSTNPVIGRTIPGGEQPTQPANAWMGAGDQLSAFGGFIGGLFQDAFTPNDGNLDSLSDLGEIIYNTVFPAFRTKENAFENTGRELTNFLTTIAPVEEVNGGYRFDPGAGYFGEMGRGVPGAALYGLNQVGGAVQASIYSVADAGLAVNYALAQTPVGSAVIDAYGNLTGGATSQDILRDGSVSSQFVNNPLSRQLGYRFRQSLAGTDLSFSNNQEEGGGQAQRYLSMIDPSKDGSAYWIQYALPVALDMISGNAADNVLRLGVGTSRVGRYIPRPVSELQFSRNADGMRITNQAQRDQIAARALSAQERELLSLPGNTPNSGSLPVWSGDAPAVEGGNFTTSAGADIITSPEGVQFRFAPRPAAQINAAQATDNNVVVYTPGSSSVILSTEGSPTAIQVHIDTAPGLLRPFDNNNELGLGSIDLGRAQLESVGLPATPTNGGVLNSNGSLATRPGDELGLGSVDFGDATLEQRALDGTPQPLLIREGDGLVDVASTQPALGGSPSPVGLLNEQTPNRVLTTPSSASDGRILVTPVAPTLKELFDRADEIIPAKASRAVRAKVVQEAQQIGAIADEIEDGILEYSEASVRENIRLQKRLERRIEDLRVKRDKPGVNRLAVDKERIGLEDELRGARDNATRLKRMAPDAQQQLDTVSPVIKADDLKPGISVAQYLKSPVMATSKDMTLVPRTLKDITQLGKFLSDETGKPIVNLTRKKPLNSNEVARLEQKYGAVFSRVGKPVPASILTADPMIRIEIAQDDLGNTTKTAFVDTPAAPTVKVYKDESYIDPKLKDQGFTDNSAKGVAESAKKLADERDQAFKELVKAQIANDAEKILEASAKIDALSGDVGSPVDVEQFTKAAPAAKKPRGGKSKRAASKVLIAEEKLADIGQVVDTLETELSDLGDTLRKDTKDFIAKADLARGVSVDEVMQRNIEGTGVDRSKFEIVDDALNEWDAELGAELPMTRQDPDVMSLVDLDVLKRQAVEKGLDPNMRPDELAVLVQLNSSAFARRDDIKFYDSIDDIRAATRRSGSDTTFNAEAREAVSRSEQIRRGLNNPNNSQTYTSLGASPAPRAKKKTGDFRTDARRAQLGIPDAPPTSQEILGIAQQTAVRTGRTLDDDLYNEAFADIMEGVAPRGVLGDTTQLGSLGNEARAKLGMPNLADLGFKTGRQLTVLRKEADQVNTKTWYHGTRVQGDNVADFHPNLGSSSNVDFGSGVYLTADPRMGVEYARAARHTASAADQLIPFDRTGNLHEVVVNLDNVIRADALASPGIKDIFVLRVGERFPDRVGRYARDLRGDVRMEDLWMTLRKQGGINETDYQLFSADVARDLKVHGLDGIRRESDVLGEDLVVFDTFDGSPLPINTTSLTPGIGAEDALDAKLARHHMDAMMYAHYKNDVTSAIELQSRLGVEGQQYQNIMEQYTKALRQGDDAVQTTTRYQRELRDAVRADAADTLAQRAKEAPDMAKKDARNQMKTDKDSPCL